jgi:hypothetical protein
MDTPDRETVGVAPGTTAVTALLAWLATGFSLLRVPRAGLPAALAETQRVLRPGAQLFTSVNRGEETGATYRYGTETGRHFVHW